MQVVALVEAEVLGDAARRVSACIPAAVLDGLPLLLVRLVPFEEVLGLPLRGCSG